MTYRRNSPQRMVSQLWNTIAPVGGINDKDPIAAMDPKFCLDMLNWFPGNASLSSRTGYREHVTNLPGPAKSVLSYLNMSGEGRVFAVTDDALFDITVSTDAPTPVDGVSITSGEYVSVVFGNVGTQWLVAVNGRGSPALLYDGTTWTEMTQGPATFAGTISGVDPGALSYVTVYKRRLWFVESDSMTAWYLPVDAIAGEAKPFYLTGVFKRGGNLLYAIDWSIDVGDGLSNMLVFVSTAGEAAVYRGDDPNDASAWSLESVIFVAPPMGNRSAVGVGGDVMFLTSFGVLELSSVLVGAAERTPLEASLSSNINRTLNRLARDPKYRNDWRLYNLSAAQALMITIPGEEGNRDTPPIQFVMNMISGAWCRYDLPVTCAGFSGGRMYFGTQDNRICEFGDNIGADNIRLDGSGGEPIVCEFQTAFTYMDDPRTLKNWKLLRPMFQADGAPNFVLRINTDFSLFPLVENPAPPPSGAETAEWDSAIWDQSKWAGTDIVYRPWIGVSGMGYSCSVLMKVATKASTKLVSLEYVYEEGGLI